MGKPQLTTHAEEISGTLVAGVAELGFAMSPVEALLGRAVSEVMRQAAPPFRANGGIERIENLGACQ